MRMININPGDYKKYFTFHGTLTCLQSEFLLRGSLAQAGLFLTQKGGVFNIYINRNGEKRCLREGSELYSNGKRYADFLSEFKCYVDLANGGVIPSFSNVPESLTKGEFRDAVKAVGKLWYYYGFAEFPYLDLAFEQAKETDNKEIEARLREVSQFKFKAREVMNAYFFQGGVIDNLLSYVSNRFLAFDDVHLDARHFYFDELLDVFDGKLLDESVIHEREDCYSAAVIDSTIVHFGYADAVRLNKQFTAFVGTDVVYGKRANPGVVRGRAVVAPMLNSDDKISAIDKAMNEGDVLITETASPDMIEL